MVKIIGDTTSCLSLAKATELGIGYLPQIIVIGDDSWRDDTELNPPGFLKKQKSSPVVPKTSAPPPSLYDELFADLEYTGEKGLVITPSQKVSGTFRSAELAAKEHPLADVTILDSGIIAGGLGTLLLKAQQMAAEGLDRETIAQNISALSQRNRTFFVVNTLEYLYKGGRIGAAAALVGSLLQMKPILTINDGVVASYEKQHTFRRAQARLVELVLNECRPGVDASISIMHGDNFWAAEKIQSELLEKLSLTENQIPIYDLTAAILTHTGPGVVVVSYFAPA